MALTALHVTFIWNAYTADGADERMDLLKSEMETDLSVSIEDADLFNSIVGEDVLNMFDMFKLNVSRNYTSYRILRNVTSLVSV